MNEVTENGEDSTGEEEEHQTAIKIKIKIKKMIRLQRWRKNRKFRSDLLVDLTLRELSGWADDTPDDRCCTEDLGTGADEVILLGRGTHVFDVGEHPRLDTKLDSSGNDGSEDLGEEQSSGTTLNPWVRLV